MGQNTQSMYIYTLSRLHIWDATCRAYVDEQAVMHKLSRTYSWSRPFSPLQAHPGGPLHLNT